MSIVINRRSLKDDNLKVTKALPAAAASATSDPIYIGGLGPHREGLKLRVSWPANTVLVAEKLLEIELCDSATTTLAVSASPAQKHTIVGATGFAAGYVDFELGQNIKAHVGFKATVETGGGSNIATILTAEVVA